MVYTIPTYTSNTTCSIYYRVLFQDFTLRSISGLPTLRGTAGIPGTYYYSESISLEYIAVFPGSICSGYSCYCTVSISDVCTAGDACVLGVLYNAHHVRSIWAFSTADTPSTRSITLGHRNTRVPQYSQCQQYPQYRTETYITSSVYRE